MAAARTIRFHVELHFSPGVNCCVQKNLPPGPGFRPHSRNEQSTQSPAQQHQNQSQQLGRIDQEDTGPEDSSSSHNSALSESPATVENSPPFEKKTEDPSSYRLNLKLSQPIPISIGRAGTSEISDMLVQSDADQSKRSLSFSQHVIHPAHSPQHEPRSRSFDHSRDNCGHHKGDSTDVSDKNFALENSSGVFLNDKEKKYFKNLFYFNSQQLSKNMLKSDKSNERDDKNLSRPRYQSLLSDSKFIKLSDRYAHLNTSSPRSRSLDFTDKDEESVERKGKQRGFVDFIDNKFDKVVDLQSLDLAHVQVLSYRKRKIASKQASVRKKQGLDKLDLKIAKSKLKTLSQQNFSDCRNFKGIEVSAQFSKSLITVDKSRGNSTGRDHSDYNICAETMNSDLIKKDNDDKTLTKGPSKNPFNQTKYCALIDLNEVNDCNLYSKSNPESKVDNPTVIVSESYTLPPIAESKSCYPLGKVDSNFVAVSKQKNISTPVPRLTCERRTHSVSHCMGLTRLSPPEPGPSRRHRHSISGQMSYLRMTSYGLMIHHQRRGGGGGSTSSLFSTAVISGSSSAPNLRDMIPNTAAVAAAIEACGGVPPIRPLETLHNALSLRQIDAFLDKMSRSTPLKNSSTPLTQSVQSPNNSMGWSGPPSFVSSSGPSSPNGLSDFLRGGMGNSDSSDFSTSFNEGFSKVGQCSGGGSDREDREIDSTCYSGHRDSLEIMELLNWNQQQHLEGIMDNMHFSPIVPAGGNPGENSGDVTPVSINSEIDRNEFAEMACGEDDDEEKTLTAYTKDEMSRPRLAEIKWTQDDNINVVAETSSEDTRPSQRFAYGRFECIGTQQASSAACEEIFEMDSENPEETTTGTDLNVQSHIEIPRVTERRYSEMSTRNASPCSSESGSPVITVAGSLKDSNCISRGFVIPDDEKE